jgi:hypothetical protein
MNTVALFDSFLTYTIDSYSTQDANWPASNLLNYEKQLRVWKTTVATNSWVILDFAAAKSPNGVILINANFATYKLQFNGTTDFSSPAIDSGNLTLAQDLLFTRRGRSFQNPLDFGAVNHRYARIYIPTQTPTDGASVFSLGAVFCTDAMFDTDIQLLPQAGGAFEVIEEGEENELSGGGKEKVRYGEPYVQVNSNFLYTRDDTDYISLVKMLNRVGKFRSLAVAFNGLITEETNYGQYSYLMKRETNPRYTLSGPGHSEIPEVVLREQI